MLAVYVHLGAYAHARDDAYCAMPFACHTLQPSE